LIEKEVFLSFLLNRADQFPTAELGHPIDWHLIHGVGDGGFPEVELFHFFRLLFFSLSDTIVPQSPGFVKLFLKKYARKY
jgi:hypothetical protein